MKVSIVLAHWAILVIFVMMLSHLGVTIKQQEFWLFMIMLWVFEINTAMYVKRVLLEKKDDDDEM